MLSSISWQQYLAAIVTITAFYYLYVATRYYKAEILSVFNRNPTSSNIFSGLQTGSAQVMGAAKLDSGTVLSDTEELQFGETLPDEIESIYIAPSNAVDDLIIEAEKLIEAFKDIDNKTEFLSLLKILGDSYKKIQDEIDLTPAFEPVLAIAEEKLKFPVALSDVEDTWA